LYISHLMKSELFNFNRTQVFRVLAFEPSVGTFVAPFNKVDK